MDENTPQEETQLEAFLKKLFGGDNSGGGS